MNTTDLAVILASLVVVVTVGLWASRRQGRSARDYFLASRQLPWWIIGAAFVSTSVSSEQIVGTVGIAYETGMGVTNWEWFILPQYTLLMLFFIPLYLKNRITTVPELLARRYGPLCGNIYSWATLVAYVFIFLVPVLYGGSLVLSQLTGFDFSLVLWVTVALVALYTAKGGLKAVVWTDAVQCLMLVGGGLVLFFVALSQIEGGWSAMVEARPDRFHLYRPASDETAPFLGMIAASFGVFLWYQGCNQGGLSTKLDVRTVSECCSISLLVKTHAAFQCRAKLSKRGFRRLDWIRGVLNRIYNSALEERKTAWEDDKRSMSMYDQMKRLTQARKSDPEGIGSISVAAERGMLRRLEGAFQAFFRRCKAGENPGYPRFRPLARMETIDIVDPRTTMVKKRARGYAIKPKGFPTIRIFPSRPLPAGCPLKALRIVRKPHRVCVDLVYEVEKEPLPRCDSAVGIDLGVRKRAVLSTGDRIERHRCDWSEIKGQQRRVARCKRGSNRRKKRVRQLARIRYRERVRNRNACHRVTTRIVRSHGLIAVEKLNVKRMTTKGLKRKGLNREILTQSWGLLRNQLQYKAEWAGREFVEVDPKYTSQDCHRCGARNRPGRSERYACAACGLRMDRDENGALNILRAGVVALGAETWVGRPSVAPEL